MKTYSITPKEVTRTWVVIDASTAPLGRVASAAAKYLIGKHKPSYTAHIDGGDYVIITNAAQLVVTGNKTEAKKYYHYSGFPGGMKEKSLKTVLREDPTVAITAAIRGMLPKNKLLDDRMKRLKVYATAEHHHEAQKPVNVGVNN